MSLNDYSTSVCVNYAPGCALELIGKYPGKSPGALPLPLIYVYNPEFFFRGEQKFFFGSRNFQPRYVRRVRPNGHGQLSRRGGTPLDEVVGWRKAAQILWESRWWVMEATETRWVFPELAHIAVEKVALGSCESDHLSPAQAA